MCWFQDTGPDVASDMTYLFYIPILFLYILSIAIIVYARKILRGRLPQTLRSRLSFFRRGVGIIVVRHTDSPTHRDRENARCLSQPPPILY
jgi:hypothetical protein